MVGSERSPESQDVHDRVINKIALTKIDSEIYHAGTNPGRKRDWPIRYIDFDRLLFPDLVVMSRRSGRIHLICEVETEETVNGEHAQLEWKPFSTTGWNFTLVVPKLKLNEALELIDEQKLKVEHLGGYEMDPAGWITLELPDFGKTPFEFKARR